MCVTLACLRACLAVAGYHFIFTLAIFLCQATRRHRPCTSMLMGEDILAWLVTSRCVRARELFCCGSACRLREQNGNVQGVGMVRIEAEVLDLKHRSSQPLPMSSCLISPHP